MWPCPLTWTAERILYCWGGGGGANKQVLETITCRGGGGEQNKQVLETITCRGPENFEILMFGNATFSILGRRAWLSCDDSQSFKLETNWSVS